MTGVGIANGAASIVNAFATQRGAAFGLDLRVEARVQPAARASVWNGRRRLPPSEARLALETARRVQQRTHDRRPLRIEIQSEIPPERGLKSSSAVGVAVARAVLDELGQRVPISTLLSDVADAALTSGTSLTGAYDDAAACALGGVVVTDNARRKIVARDQLPNHLVAWVSWGRGRRRTGALDRRRFEPLSDAVALAWDLARRRRYRAAMLVNTLAYAPTLGLVPAFTFEVLEEGAYAAGLSGKGPAEVALVNRGKVPRVRSLKAGTRMVPLARQGSA